MTSIERLTGLVVRSFRVGPTGFGCAVEIEDGRVFSALAAEWLKPESKVDIVSTEPGVWTVATVQTP